VSRIEQRFADLATAGRRALIPYVVAGDPVVDITVPLMHRLVSAGADVLELGVPFSDPMAEGPVIQLAHERALANEVSLRGVIAMVSEFRRDDQDTPVLLMGYANPLERIGYGACVEAASQAGVDALLTVDLPPEECQSLRALLQSAGMDNIFLISPTTTTERIVKFTEQASGFVYYVSLKGVTGAGHLDTAAVANKVAEIRACCSLPVAVGFGIKDAASAAAVSEVADGVVVGSALVQVLADAAADGKSAQQVCDAAAGLLQSMRTAMDAN
jgi:tryptophan synthase alpha chain